MRRFRRWTTMLMIGSFLMMAPGQASQAASPSTGTAIKQLDTGAAADKKTIKKAPTAVKQKQMLRRQNVTQTPKGVDDPDLMAELISAVPRGTDQINISGRITNIGGGDFVSGPGQAAAEIVIYLPHLTGPEAYPIVRTIPITRMIRGQRLPISVSVPMRTYFPDLLRWGSTPSQENECPANMRVSFIVQVSYDPDLHDDGNELNDDGNHGNDQAREDAPPSGFGYLADCPG